MLNKSSNILTIYAVIHNTVSGVESIKNPYTKHLLNISILLGINRKRLNTIKKREKVF